MLRGHFGIISLSEGLFSYRAAVGDSYTAPLIPWHVRSVTPRIRKGEIPKGLRDCLPNHSGR
jgi:hypothetical protein